jgi:predicted Zn-dependent peptidase
MTASAIEIPHEQYKLDNGLTVILHQDSSLPQVVINLWYGVGSKDEIEGRSGFAHLFEHLMFMGTTRLPDSGFDDLMESRGGWNNAWTSEDATDYYDVGPSNLLSTLLWMEADRMDGLAGAMTQEKLDLQREVVRNERRQTSEDAPYGEVWLVMPEMMYPAGHPYAHTVIGSHEDLQAATINDVVGFFDTWYVPGNASLVVAGDFDPAAVRALIEKLFGGLPAAAPPPRPKFEPPETPMTSLIELTDSVQIPMSVLLWHTPAAMAEGDAELDLVSSILAGGRSSRLYKRLVHEEGLALEVDAAQYSQQLSSLFVIEFKPTETGTLEKIEAIIAEEIAKLAAEGPSEVELKRARNQLELGFIQGLESLQHRASRLNRYNALTGNPGFLQADLNRYRSANAEGIQAAAARLSPDRMGLIRVHPEEESEE